MKVFSLVLILTLIAYVESATKYDFNACRIQNCIQKQKLCIEEEGQCLKGFSDTRKCLDYCLGEDQLEDYKQCWMACKSGIFTSSTLYEAVAKCYEEICYMNGHRVQIVMGLLAVLLAVIMF